jgi:hypothetical protein
MYMLDINSLFNNLQVIPLLKQSLMMPGMQRLFVCFFTASMRRCFGCEANTALHCRHCTLVCAYAPDVHYLGKKGG